MKVINTSRSNKYCVPAALSAIMGMEVDDLLPEIREHLGTQEITGLFIPIALSILKKWGYSSESLSVLLQQGDTRGKSYTLLSLCRVLTRLNRENIYLITIRGHALVLHAGRIVDSWFPEGFDYQHYPRGKAIVDQTFRILPPSPVTQQVNKIVLESRKK